jgi:2-polyprenyl-3-methyl-5-hydroxy-6-metoxy-1,4-benzoquinol methylase
MATTLTAKHHEYIPKNWEEPDCPLCGAQQSTILERFGFAHRYTYQKCGNCGLAYQKPRPIYDDEFTDTAYEVYSTDTDAHWRNGKLTPKGCVVHQEYSHIVDELESFTQKKGRLLEIGCNTGFFLKAAKDKGWCPVGVEISKTMAEIATKQFDVEAVSGDWMTMDFPNPFDVIYCSHVIEHVPNPSDWMEKFRACIKPGGVICLSVPNMNSIDRKYKRLLKKIGLRKDKWQPWQTPDHLFEPCEKSMRRFFARNRFEVLSTYTYPSEWLGNISCFHRLFHFWLRWGAKQRFYIRPI